MSIENWNWDNIIVVVAFVGFFIIMIVGERVARFTVWYRQRRNER